MKKQKEHNKYDISYKQLIKRLPKLYQFMQKYKWIFFSLGSFDVIRQWLVILPALIIQYTIDEVIPYKDIYSINILFGMIAFMFLTRSGLLLGHIYIRWHLDYNIRKDIREKLFNSLLVQTPVFFSKRVSGEITSRMNNDVGSVSYLASAAFFDLLNTFLQIQKNKMKNKS